MQLSSAAEAIDTLPHPTKFNEAALDNLIMTHEQPKEEFINECKSKVSLATHEANTNDEIIQAKKLTVILVNRDFPTYHWCFYQMMHDCDKARLKEGIPVKQKLESFNESMKQLWVLSRSLDAVLQNEVYFKYLRKRYMVISKNYFGRNLNLIGRPFDEKITPDASKDEED